MWVCRVCACVCRSTDASHVSVCLEEHVSVILCGLMHVWVSRVCVCLRVCVSVLCAQAFGQGQVSMSVLVVPGRERRGTMALPALLIMEKGAGGGVQPRPS